MSKKLSDMNYLEMIAEQERVEIALIDTKSIFLKRDYTRYLEKIKKEIKDYEKHYYGNK